MTGETDRSACVDSRQACWHYCRFESAPALTVEGRIVDSLVMHRAAIGVCKPGPHPAGPVGTQLHHLESEGAQSGMLVIRMSSPLVTCFVPGLLHRRV